LSEDLEIKDAKILVLSQKMEQMNDYMHEMEEKMLTQHISMQTYIDQQVSRIKSDTEMECVATKAFVRSQMEQLDSSINHNLENSTREFRVNIVELQSAASRCVKRDDFVEAMKDKV